MHMSIHPSVVKLWLSANDTYEWANRDGASWPGSQLSGCRLSAEFDSNGLVDYSIDGKTGVDVDVNEFNAIIADFLKTRLQPGHECYAVAVGQFHDEWSQAYRDSSHSVYGRGAK